MSTTLTIRLDEQTKERLDRLAGSVARTKSYLVSRAIQDYLEANEWQVNAIKKAVDKADRHDAKFAVHEDVSAWLETWGTENEKEPPQCA
ncbi:MAG: ribbon-helix-helix protein, CopG family [Nitrospirae bacterium]|nr:MAG: ribbon-helix-helix protein, CopG family [Nitrospirota bacterium]